MGTREGKREGLDARNLPLRPRSRAGASRVPARIPRPKILQIRSNPASFGGVLASCRSFSRSHGDWLPTAPVTGIASGAEGDAALTALLLRGVIARVRSSDASGVFRARFPAKRTEKKNEDQKITAGP